MNKNVILIGMCSFLVGCFAATVEYSSPRSVTISHPGNSHIERTQRAADQECAKYGRYARFARDGTADSRILYDCVD